MKTIKYILMGMLGLLVSFSGMYRLRAQEPPIEFLETYSVSEITSRLRADDAFFQAIEINQKDPESALLGTCAPGDTSGVWKTIHSAEFLRQVPDDIRFAWGIRQEDQQIPLYALKQWNGSGAGQEHWNIRKVSMNRDTRKDPYSLLISFSEADAERWAVLTGKNVGKDLAILIEGKVYVAPRVRDQITGGSCLISGNFSEKELLRIQTLLEQSGH